jgi:hypothetical protein
VPRHTPLRFYGQASDAGELDWDWVDGQLREAGTYWVTARTEGHPHPRPVWGVWLGNHLYLSIGTPVTTEALATDPTVTVHLDSGTEVVIVEGRAYGPSTDAEVVAEYNRKYDWSYDADTYGRLTIVLPETVLAWRTRGWAGRESFQQTGKWQLG